MPIVIYDSEVQMVSKCMFLGVTFEMLLVGITQNTRNTVKKTRLAAHVFLTALPPAYNFYTVLYLDYFILS